MDESRLGAFLARGHRALQDTVPPRTRKPFAALMLDTGLWNAQRLTLDSAIARVGDCLNPNRGGGQSFRMSELWLWMRESGHHALFNAMAEDLGYRVDQLPDTQRQQALLARIEARLESLSDELGELQLLRDQLSGSSDKASRAQKGEVVRFSRDLCEARGF